MNDAWGSGPSKQDVDDFLRAMAKMAERVAERAVALEQRIVELEQRLAKPKCPVCHGTGMVSESRRVGDTFSVTYSPCACGGRMTVVNG